MRKIREVLRLTHALGLSRRLVGEATGIGKTAVGEYVRRAAVWVSPGRSRTGSAMRSWSGCCFRQALGVVRGAHRAGLGADACGAEAARRDADVALGGVSRRARPKATAIRWFCELYGGWRKRHARRRCGRRMWRATSCSSTGPAAPAPVFDAMTGEVHRAHLFVAALRRVELHLREARWSETLPDWIGAHVNALDLDRRRAEGVRSRQSRRPGSPSRRATSPASTGPTRTLPITTASLCCRRALMKPRDKAKVEVAVAIV